MLRAAMSLTATMLLVSVAHAAPDQRAIAEGLDTALGAGRTPPAAVSIEGCETVPGRPGYDCTFSISECFDGDTPITLCDDPGYSQRALFIGGDNGWLALDIQDSSETTPHVPLDPTATVLNDLTPQWLEGSWNFDNCENDGGLSFDRDGQYAVMGGIGRWALADNVLTLTLTHRIDVEGPADPQPIAQPEAIQWQLVWLGRNVVNVTFDVGENQHLIRC